MVLIDDYSRYPIVERITSTSTELVIPRLEGVFAMFGVPQILRSDNGPPFQGHLYSQFAEHMGFRHKKISPLHPKGNSIAEAFMKPLQKAIKTAHASGKSYKTELHTFLMNYRNSPHSTTNVAPAQVMFGRKLKTKLPKFSIKRKDSHFRSRDSRMKEKNKANADIKSRAKQQNVSIGDKVLIKRQKHNKVETPYNPKPGKIVKIKGSMITVTHEGKLITRDVSQFKILHSPTTPTATESTPTKTTTSTEKTLKPPENQFETFRRSARKRKPPIKYRDKF